MFGYDDENKNGTGLNSRIIYIPITDNEIRLTIQKLSLSLIQDYNQPNKIKLRNKLYKKLRDLK